MTNKANNNNSNIIVDKGMPLKIFYLKETEQTKQIQQNDKPTLAYLSSFIQGQRVNCRRQNQNSQRASGKLDQSEEKMLYRTHRIYNTTDQGKKAYKAYNTQYGQGGQQFRKFVMQNKMIKNRTQCNRRKKYSDYEDPNSLSQLLGKNWVNVNQHMSKPNMRKISKSIIRQDESILIKQEKHASKQKNHRLFRKQFQSFIKNKSISDIKTSRKEPKEPKLKYVVNASETENRHILDFQRQENPQDVNYSVRNIFQERKGKNRSQQSRNHRRIQSTNASIIARLNFKQINNFAWSRVEQNKSEFVLQAFRV